MLSNLDSILKSRDITLPKKVQLVKATVFPVVMYGCESWTIKKSEGWRIDAFELWCWRRLLRVPWTARRPTHSISRKSVLNNHWKDWCWMASPTLWTWVSASSESWWWTGKPGVLYYSPWGHKTGAIDWTEGEFVLLGVHINDIIYWSFSDIVHSIWCSPTTTMWKCRLKMQYSFYNS